MKREAFVERLTARAFVVPTSEAEEDGTFDWTSTTLVTVDAEGGGERGFGYSYGSAAMVPLVGGLLADAVTGLDALAVESAWRAMQRAVRNAGRPGIAACAISAVDVALWDLKARLLGVPLVRLLGAARRSVPAYGSGGFTNASVPELKRQLGEWAEAGFQRVKLKVGANPADDVARVRAAREAVGRRVELMVDANGAYERKQALEQAESFAELGVRWFEEPVSSDDLEGLRFLRDRGPGGLCIAAGEYGYEPRYFRRMLEAQAVDVLQADATRCLGVTGFMAAARLCESFGVPLSAHTAPSLHAHLGCAAGPMAHVEYFHDHARIEELLFDGFAGAHAGALWPDLGRPGLGLALKERDAERFAISGGTDAAVA